MTDDSSPRHLLFVCGRAQWRSPTAERIFGRDPRYATRARGLSSSAERPLREGDVSWADVIFVMESEHSSRLRKQFRPALGSTPIHVLDIPDEFEFMDPELVERLELSVPGLLAGD